jgi:hypothetical protein
MRWTLAALMSLMALASFGAYLVDVPYTYTQPDGTTVECLVTGDEYYHWVHDSDGFVILRDEVGFLVYADKVDGKLVPTPYLVGQSDLRDFFNSLLEVAPTVNGPRY